MRLKSVVAVTCMLLVTYAPVYSKCPGHWSAFEKNCYIFINVHITWREALKMCRIYKGHLLEINSSSENSFTSTLLKGKNAPLWLGITDMGQQGTWVSATSGARVNYTNWGQGLPHSKPGMNCATVDGGVWKDTLCSMRLTFVCKHKMAEK
ncbi:perlucin-like protein [Pomacea canaliculata]|uniref:perlucin-like protein n=1 Tax=Pomacea canaliculata TaxID=400727 RepID=UPI000D73A71B|nr:perlucin-like protein [Pomacea canaliculata]